VHVLTIVAWGGVGKSALINEWLGLMAQREYRGAQRVFGWSFYRQGTGESLASADQFIDAALRWFGDPEPRVGSPRDKGIRLAELVRSASTLLVLDGLEPLQHPPGPNSGSIRDEALAVLIRELAAQNRGLCVITTRESVADIAARQGRTATNIALNHLPPETGARLLRALGARGSENELKTASVDYQGHALALTLLGTYIRDVWSGDIRRRSEFELVSGSPEESKDARRMLSSYEAWFRQNGHDSEVAVLLLLGFFDRPASPEELDCLRDADNLGWLSKAVHELSDEEFRQVCARLRKARLLSPEVPMDKTIDAHPLVREYCARRLLEDNPNLWRAGHERLYEFLINSSKMLPDTLEEMLPLYAAVRHGCAAERYDDALFQVYWKRIQRKNEFYSLKVLGAIGADIAALANFFERLWDKPLERISPKGQSLLLDEAGESLHVLGRVSDAVKPMKLLLRRGLDSKNLKDAVRGAITLSELSLTMGKIEEAVSFGCDGVKYADEKRGNFHRQVSRSTLADALHQSGKFAEAERWFAEAEEIEKQRKPERGILSSMQGYAYCELLLGLGRFEEVERRSENAMRFAQSERSLLAIALSGLALGRAQLCRAVRDGIYDHSKTAAELEMAIDGFHRAGAEFQLPRVLLARAELRRIDGQLTDARRDISEAQEIAARGEMKLHQADCMLESVRISIAAGKMDEAKDALMVAERMVGETGYGRRISALNYLHDEIGNRPS
jgi:tetratricopeptide (TPR) repeat protein